MPRPPYPLSKKARAAMVQFYGSGDRADKVHRVYGTRPSFRQISRYLLELRLTREEVDPRTIRRALQREGAST